MNEQNNNQTEAPQTQQPASQPIIINNVIGQSDDSGKKKGPGFLKVCVYSVLTGGIYLIYYIVKLANGGYRTK